MQQREVKKLYYSIGEVSSITGLKQYVLRYWETEFPHIKPSKNRAGNRVYKDSDLRSIKELKNLLHNQKFTIKGAKQYLKTHKQERQVQKSIKKVLPMLSQDELQVLKKLKIGLADLLKGIDELKD